LIIITFDDPGILAAAKRDPNGFVAGLETPVTLDEAQHVPELFPVIKSRHRPQAAAGTILAHRFGKRHAAATALRVPAGCMEILTLWPFSQAELRGAKQSFLDTLYSCKPVSVSWIGNQPCSGAELFAGMVAGGFPPVVGHRSAARRDAWLGSYVTTMLQRQIRDIANIADATAVPQLLSFVAAGAGGLLNFADLPARSLCRKRR